MTSRPNPTHRGRALALTAVCLQLGLALACSRPQLRPGIALRRTIQTSEVQAYEVRLRAGDFLRVTLDQLGIDVALELAGPDGRILATVDGPNPAAEYGAEDLAAIAAQPGLYEIRVRGGVKNEPAAAYRIRMEAPRPASAADRRRVEAVRANQAATDLMAAQGAATRPRQAELREQALEIWRALGETAREADTRLQLGILRFDHGDLTAASEHLHRAAALYHQAGDAVGESKALNEAGRTCDLLGRRQEALQEVERAAQLAARAGARWPRVNALTNAGFLLAHQNRAREAIARFEEALPLTRDLACQGCQGRVLVDLAGVYDDLAETLRAVELYEQALDLKSTTVDDQALALNNLGLAYHQLGSFEWALDDFKRSKDLVLSAATCNNQGQALERLGRDQEAAESFREALALAQPNDVRVEAYALYNLGALERREGQREPALRAWDRVETLAAGRPELEAVALLAHAAGRGERGDLAGARAAHRRSIQLARERGDRGWEANSTLSLARVERMGGDLPAARRDVEHAVEIIESLRSQVLDPELRSLFLAGRQSFYALYVDTLMDLEREHPGETYGAQALRVSERARARSFLDLLAEIHVDIRHGVDPRLLRLESDLRAEVNDLDLQQQELIHRRAPAAAVQKLSGRVEEALRQHGKVADELRRNSPGYAALTQPQPLDAAAIQQRVLDARTLLLEYSLGDDRSYLWAVTPDAVRTFELPPRAEIERAGRAFYAAVYTQGATNVETAERAGLELSRMILAPAADLLGDRNLLVVPDGILQYVPFAALPLPAGRAEPLIARHGLVSLPSASLLAVLRQEVTGRRPAAKTLAVLAAPVIRRPPVAGRLAAKAPAVSPPQSPLSRGGDPAGSPVDRLDSFGELPFADEEAAKIAALVPDERQKWVERGAAASLASIAGNTLADYRYVHFATHAFLDVSHPELSGLALSPDARGDYLLHLQDIYNLRLDADLVTLSACETALGKEIRGEGLIGLTRGFMYAGAARVLASLWRVDDRSTAKLMEKLYYYLLVEKRPAAEALRRAQLELPAEYPWAAHPYYWAGFVLQGDWR